MFKSNLSITPIVAMLASIADVGYLSAAKLRKLSMSAMYAHATAAQLGFPQGESVTTPVAHALDVVEMTTATRPLLTHGSSPLVSAQISAVECRSNHVRSCVSCSSAGRLLTSCYYSPMDQVLSHGWCPRFDPDDVKVKYASRNSAKVSKFDNAVRKTLDKLLKAKVVRVAEEHETMLVSSVNLVVKKVDSQWASSKGLSMDNDAELAMVNRCRKSESLPEIKMRVVHDYTAPGLNAAQLKCRYSNIDISDLLQIMHPDCWFAVGDLSSYYESFSLANDFVGWFCFQLFGVIYVATRIMFGFAPAPAFCATFTAEMIRWIKSLGILVVAMTDDFCIVAPSEVQCRSDMSKVTSMLSKCGFIFNQDKFQLDKSIVFIGFLVDSATMSVSFHPSGVSAYLFVLRSLIQKIAKEEKMSKEELESLGGKLNHYAVLIQQGRLHIWYIWAVVHKIRKIKKFRPMILRDLHWWENVLSKVASDGKLPHVFPIISASEIKNSKEMVMVVRSDASGLIDNDPSLNGGWGFITGGLNDPDPEYKFGRWYGKYQFGVHSHHGELMVLLLYLEVYYHQCKDKVHPQASRANILFWVTDCASAAYSINKGYCRSPVSLAVLSSILEFCDASNIWIVALWWPREEGKLEDLLTHMSSILNRDLGEGQAVDLAGFLKSHC